MVILDKDGNLVESPDPERGRVEVVEERVTHRYVTDAAERGHWETVAEYPETGGSDVEWRVDSPEEGHWETVGADGVPVAHYDGAVPDGLPRDQEASDTWSHGLYVEYTADELADLARQRSEAEEALSHNMLFAEWAAGSDYKTSEVVRYGGNLYRLLQDVTGAQAEHTPDVATSLYKRVGEPDPSGVWPWVQPLGATDAYKAGDKVSHNGKVWASTVDNNVWEPGVYGWEESE